MSYDSAAWGALAGALTILGGIITWFRWRSRGLPSLLRGAGLSLVPIAAWLTGVLELVADISGDVSRWALQLVFSPVVWIGIVLSGLAVVLFGAGTMLKNRSGDAPREVTAPTPPAVDRSAGKRSGKRSGKGSKTDSAGVEGMDDIDAILRKHGIS